MLRDVRVQEAVHLLRDLSLLASAGGHRPGANRPVFLGEDGVQEVVDKVGMVHLDLDGLYSRDAVSFVVLTYTYATSLTFAYSALVRLLFVRTVMTSSSFLKGM